MFKRASTLLAMAILLVTNAVPAYALTDVDGTRYGDAYAFLEGRGAVRGYADGSGRPFNTINRAEALKVLLELQDNTRERVQWYRDHMSSLPLFLDYGQQQWFAAYVEAGFEADILRGYPDRTFRPGNSLKVEEALAMILRSVGEQPSAEGGEWYSGYVQYALQRNLVYGGERLYVGTPITRGQFFDIVYRLDTVRSQQLTAFVDPEPPPPDPVPAVTQPVNPVVTHPQQPVDPGTLGPLQQYASSKHFAVSVPRLGIVDLTITHPGDALSSNGLLSVLKNGVGHLFSYPGRGGKIMVYGHSSSYAWDVSQFTKIFTKVNQLQAGDRVYVTYDGTLYIYQVTHQQTIAPTDIRPFQGRGEELILFTCWPVGTTKSRLLVHATPVTTVALR